MIRLDFVVAFELNMFMIMEQASESTNVFCMLGSCIYCPGPCLETAGLWRRTPRLSRAPSLLSQTGRGPQAAESLKTKSM